MNVQELIEHSVESSRLIHSIRRENTDFRTPLLTVSPFPLTPPIPSVGIVAEIPLATVGWEAELSELPHVCMCQDDRHKGTS